MFGRTGRRWLPVCLAAVGLLLATAGVATAQVLVWANYYDPGVNGNDAALAVTCDANNSVIVTGASQEGLGGRYDMATVKYRSNGDEFWSRRYGTPGAPDSGLKVITDPDSNVYVLGTLTDSSGRRAMGVVKYLPDGGFAWVRMFSDSISATGGKGIGIDASGFIYVVGERVYSPVNYDLVTAKLSVDGDVVWQEYLPVLADSHVHDISMCVDAQRNVLIAAPVGYYRPSPARRDYLTVKYNTNGDTVWTRRWDNRFGLDDYPVDILTDESCNVYVLGAAYASTTEWDYSVLKYTPDGRQLFECRWNNAENNGWDVPSDMALDSKHNIIVTGYSYSDATSEDIYTVAFSGIGDSLNPPDTLWAALLNYPGIDDVDSGAVVHVDRMDNVYVVGYCNSSDSFEDICTAKYNSKGEQKWVAYYNDPVGDTDLGFAIAADALGGIYIAGTAYWASNPDYLTLKYTGPDAGVSRIIAPGDSIRVGTLVEPKAVVRNYSPINIPTMRVEFKIGNYVLPAEVNDLAANDSVMVTFETWLGNTLPGTFLMSVYTILPDDQEPHNDSINGVITVVTPWVEKAPVPSGPKSKRVKDGGSLAFDRDRGNIYAMKGNNTYEFYVYNCSSDVWASRESVPAGTARKKPRKGGALVYGRNDLIYASKGNKTQEFWAYDVVNRRWIPRANTPDWLKGGAAMTLVPTQNKIYMLRASNYQDFYSYDIAGDTWSRKSMLPLGTSGKRPKEGTCLAFDGVDKIYAIKGKTQDFFRYDIEADTWIQMAKSLPIVDPRIVRKKKNGDGGSMAFAYGKVHTLKGNNSNEFWTYTPAQDSWAPVDTMAMGPLRKRVKAGASLVEAEGKIYAIKGNNTLEFYMYNADITLLGKSVANGAQGSPVLAGVKFALGVAPNPFHGAAVVRYALPKAGRVSLRLYDVNGRLSADLFTGAQEPGYHNLKLTDASLATGVYFLKLRYDDGAQTKQLTSKVLVQR